MDPESIGAVASAIATAHWNLNYSAFCAAAGFAEDSYSEEKWRQWLSLAHSFAAFDKQTLARITLVGNGVTSR